jgi:2-polyprenyl-3-methyl-5-hydroxy-6-metoxy-1,4-benzoquinol methylase
MTKNEISGKLKESYLKLLPFSDKYKIDFRRFLFSLSILDKLDLEEKKVLDVGTGIGIIPVTLNKMGANAEGIDYYIFPENNNEMFKQGSIDDLKNIWSKNNTTVSNNNIYDSSPNLPESNFDIVISEATIEHLKDPKKFIERCISLLKPGGYLLISTPNISKLLNRLRFLFGRSPNWPVAEFYNAGDDFTGHWREYTISELRTICEHSNLAIINTYNKNLLAHFRGFPNWKKNYRAVIALLANIIPNAGDMNYILCRKKS